MISARVRVVLNAVSHSQGFKFSSPYAWRFVLNNIEGFQRLSNQFNFHHGYLLCGSPLLRFSVERLVPTVEFSSYQNYACDIIIDKGGIIFPRSGA